MIFFFLLTKIASQLGCPIFGSSSAYLSLKPQQPNTCCTSIFVVFCTVPQPYRTQLLVKQINNNRNLHTCSANCSCCSILTPRQAHAIENCIKNNKNKITMYYINILRENINLRHEILESLYTKGYKK